MTVQWAEVAGMFRPQREFVSLCARADLPAEIDRLVERWQEAQRAGREDEVQALSGQLLKLHAEAAASRVRFTFQALGRAAYEELRRAHPATRPQLRLVPDLAYNPDTFAPALFAATCVEPTGMSMQDWTRICVGWTDGQVMALFRACQAVHLGVVTVPNLPPAVRRDAAAEG